MAKGAQKSNRRKAGKDNTAKDRAVIEKLVHELDAATTREKGKELAAKLEAMVGPGGTAGGVGAAVVVATAVAKTRLHAFIEQRAGWRPAVAVERRLLEALVLDSVRRAAGVFAPGVVLPGDDFGLRTEIEIVVDQVSLDPASATVRSEVDSIDPETLRLSIEPAFSFELVLRVAAEPTLEFSSIKFEVSDAKLTAQGADNLISFSGVQATTRTQVDNLPTRAEALLRSGVPEQDLLIAEAAFGIVSRDKITSSLFGSPADLDLSMLFGGLQFRGFSEFHVLDSYLVVIPRAGIDFPPVDD